MSRSTISMFTFVLLIAWASASSAQPKKEPEPPPQAQTPAPGTCASFRNQKGLKVCSLIDQRGSFDIVVYPPHGVRVQFQQGVDGLTPPLPEQLFQQATSGNWLTVAPLDPTFKETVSTVVKAGDATVTLNFVPDTRKPADTQVDIVDPDLDARELEIERRVAERLATERAALAQQAKASQARIDAGVRTRLLSLLAEGGVDVRDPRGTTEDENDHLIILRVEKVVRFGRSRYLLVRVRNRSGDPFEVKNVRLWVKERGKETLARKLEWQFPTPRIEPATDMLGAVLLPLRDNVPPKTTLRLRVEEATDADRSVELGGIGMP